MKVLENCDSEDPPILSANVFINLSQSFQLAFQIIKFCRQAFVNCFPLWEALAII